MMKKSLFCIVSLLFVCSVSHADLLVKMNTEFEKTDLLPNEIITVTLSAKADGASGTNGLFGWGLDALVNAGGVVEIVDGTIEFLAPDPWDDDDTKWVSYNDTVTGGTGSIEYLQLIADFSFYENSTVGVGLYSPIAKFNIKAIGSVGQSVTYTLGGINFEGLLADVDTVLDGDFQSGLSQNVFTIVPEPATLVLLGLSAVGCFRRKK